MADDSLNTGPILLSKLRADYPGSAQLNDDEFLRRVHKNLYPNLSTRDFVSRVDYDTQRAALQKENLQNTTINLPGIGEVRIPDTIRTPLGGVSFDMAKGGGQRLLAGAGHEFNALKQTLGKLFGQTTPQEIQDEAQIAAPLMKTPEAQAGALGADVALSALPGGSGAGITRATTQAAGRMLPQTIKALAPYIGSTAGGATAGAVSGAALHPEDSLGGAESGAGWGATLGAVVPAAQTVYNAVAKRLTNSGQSQLAAEEIMRKIKDAGEDPQQILAALRGPDDVIPQTAAAQSGSKALAGMENPSMTRNPVKWWEFKKGQSDATTSAINDATQEAATLKSDDPIVNPKIARGQAWDANKQTALDLVDPDILRSQIAPFMAKLDVASRSSQAAASNTVQDVISGLQKDIPYFGGENITADHLMSLRKRLNTVPSYQASTAYDKADPSDPAVKSIISAIDDMLDKSTMGAWRGVNSGYAEMTPAVKQAEAAQRVRDDFFDTLGYPKVRTVAGTPEYTSQSITKAVENQVDPNMQQQLSDDAMQGLYRTRAALEKKELGESLRKIASGRGASTAGNIAALADEGTPGLGELASSMVEKSVPMAGPAWGTIKQFGSIRKNRILDDVLQSPSKTADLMSAPRPAVSDVGGLGDLDYTQQLLLSGLRADASNLRLTPQQQNQSQYP